MSSSSSLHAAIIMDGNGRWAQQKGLPRKQGHRKGVDVLRQVIKAAPKYGIDRLTLFGFSTENWNRPEDEVDILMNLLIFFLKRDLLEIHQNNVNIRFIGEKSDFSEEIQILIQESESLTQDNKGLNLCIALSYGGRNELLNVVKKVAQKVQLGQLKPDDITQSTINDHLYLQRLDEPDFLIRTSGEQRLSNFLLWQLAYSELIFDSTLWPDFGEENLKQAVEEFHSRDRRYGCV